ncbi:MAG TPA: hypothetical protein VMV98_01180 [Acidobacteriaceae bacterium]|nr:hypothetical protein [Acidobacteriaceae bacterium]
MSKREEMKAEIEALAADGLIMPASLVELARNPDSSLHDQFTWDDGEAAQAWRIEQARRLLRVFVVEVSSPKSSVMTRAFVSLSSDRDDGGYRAIADVLSDDDLKAKLIHDALDDLERVKVKYQTLHELDPVFSAVKKVRRKHQDKNSGMRAAA